MTREKHGMRYQVRIIGRNTPARWWRKERAGRDYNFGSSETLEGAYSLLETAAFYLGEIVVIEDQETSRWVSIKRGRVLA